MLREAYGLEAGGHALARDRCRRFVVPFGLRAWPAICSGAAAGPGSAAAPYTPRRRKRSARRIRPVLRMLSSMRSFTVFSRPGGDIEVVKQGWSWPAFVFNVLWALWHRMWLLAFGAWLGEILGPAFLAAVFEFLSRAGLDVLPLVLAAGLAFGIGVPVAFGSRGNAWRCAHLRSCGFVERGTVVVPSAGTAQSMFLRSEGAPAAAHRGW